MQRDPHETALVLISVMIRNAEGASVFTALAALGQFSDGLNLYESRRSNPMILVDPSGEVLPVILLAPLIGAAAGASVSMIYEAMTLYASYADGKMSGSEMFIEILKAGGIGAAAGAVIGLGAGGIAAGLVGGGVATGPALLTGWAAMGLSLSPVAVGLGIARYQSATEEWDRVMAMVDITAGAFGIVGSHVAAAAAMRGPTIGTFMTANKMVDAPIVAAIRALLPSKINMAKQGKHIPGHPNYMKGRSILTHPDPQALLDAYRGTGIPVGKTPPGPGYKEAVDFHVMIGHNVDGKTGQGTPTTWGIVHYSKSDSHIVPSAPRGE